jgi:hypothetical protein
MGRVKSILIDGLKGTRIFLVRVDKSVLSSGVHSVWSDPNKAMEVCTRVQQCGYKSWVDSETINEIKEEIEPTRREEIVERRDPREPWLNDEGEYGEEPDEWQ